MKTITKRGLMAASTIALVGLATLVPVAANAAEPNGSNSPVWLFDADNYEDFAGDTMSWDNSYPVGSSKSAAELAGLTPANPENTVARFTGPANATGVSVFLAVPGQELTPIQWIGVSGAAFVPGTKQVGTPYLPLNNMSDGPSSTELATVKANGGTYSLGIVYTANNGVQGLSGDWTTITVAPGGAWTWTAPTVVPVDPCVTNPNGAGCPPVRPQTAGGADVESAADLAPAQQITGLVTGISGNTASIDAGSLTGFVQVWAYSQPTYLGSTTLNGSGEGTISLAGLPTGAHTLILTETDGTVLGWDTFNVTTPTTDEAETDLTVDVITSNKFELNGVNSAVDLGDVKRGQTSTPVNLGAFTVIDDRNALLGWDLTANVDTFVNGSATVPNSALGIAASATSAPAGIAVTAGTTAGSAVYGAVLASGAAGSSTGEVGTGFNAALSFKAPINAVAGTYTSTLTLTLASK